MMNPIASWWCRKFSGQEKKVAKQRSSRRKMPLNGLRIAMENLEIRSMLSASPIAPTVATVSQATYRTYDGTGNNVANQQWGSTAEDLLRKAAAAYSDGISTPAGATRPSARQISNVIADHVDEDVKNDRQMSAMVYAWGQFIDHDIDLTSSASPKEAFNIKVPKGDPVFDPLGTGTKTISLSRSEWDAATGTSKSNPRQQLNDITAFLDGSMVYGSDATTAASLRTFQGGKLKTSAGNLLPYASDGVMFQAGDVRANENTELTSLQTLFVREHNRIATQLAKDHPTWTDEQLYQEARRWVVGEIEAITFNEFLPALLGPNAVGAYQGYNPNVNPGIATEFSTAAFRVGHTLLGNDVGFLDNNGNDVHDEVSLKSQFHPGW
ncbi:MAG: peroxidase family protein [Planctomycetales bacterium]